MKQTPVHGGHNPDLLDLIPNSVQRVIEVGCSSGNLAKAFKRNSDVNWVGVEIDEEYAELARRHCNSVEVSNIEDCDESFYLRHADRDCWIFGDCLEHLKDPWAVLRNIREVIPSNGSVVACIPNAQHWSLVVKLALGVFAYEESGLLDKTHLRWFTRTTMMELFESQGFRVSEMRPRVFEEPGREAFLPTIQQIAKTAGVDPTSAMQDSLPLQYVLCATPA